MSKRLLALRFGLALFFAGVLGVILWAQQPVSQSGTWSIAGTVSLPTGASTAAKQDTIIGHVDDVETLLDSVSGFLEDILAAMSPDATHDSAGLATGAQVMAEFDDTSTDAVDEGDAARLRVDALRNLRTMPADCGDSAAVASADINLSAGTGNTEILAISGSTVIYVCGYNLTAGDATTFQWIKGTGTACATNEADLETLTFSSTIGLGIANVNAGATQFKTAAGDALCVERGSSVALTGRVTYVRR